MAKYVLGIDQSTQGTKVLLFDEQGKAVMRVDKSHEQLVDDKGWVEHNPVEIWDNLLVITKELVILGPLVSAISGKPHWPGIRKPESRSIMP